MKIRLLLVGRPRDDAAAVLHDRYAERITRLGVTFESHWVPEGRSSGRPDEPHLRVLEARRLLERLAPRDRTIALDRQGRMSSSEELAQQLERWAERRATFVIGGPCGLDESILRRADWCWSLSPLTFPHELVRVLVVEQVYRALMLLRRLPYHR